MSIIQVEDVSMRFNLAQEKTLAPCKRMENLIKKVLRAKPLQAARQRSIIKSHFKKEGD